MSFHQIARYTKLVMDEIERKTGRHRAICAPQNVRPKGGKSRTVNLERIEGTPLAPSPPDLGAMSGTLDAGEDREVSSGAAHGDISSRI